MGDLTRKRGVVLGVSNDKSIAYGCIKALINRGCTDIVVTYANDKALPYVKAALSSLNVTKLLKCDVENKDELVNLFNELKNTWGKIDFLIHSIAYLSQDCLHGRVIDANWNDFSRGLHVSCFSFIECCKLAENILNDHGTVITMSYLGSNRVIENYGAMGPIKACLESSVKYLANELADREIKVFAISPGPIDTRAARGLNNFDQLLKTTAEIAPIHRNISTEEVGNLAAFLISDLSRGMTGQTIFIDGGYFIKG